MSASSLPVFKRRDSRPELHAGSRAPISAVRPPLAPAFARSFPARTTLTQPDRIVVRAIAEAMFSHDGEVERARLDAHVDEVDAFISAASEALRFGLRVALFVVRIAPLLFFFRMRTLERLSVDDRVTILSRLERSRITNLSLAFIGWRSVMTLVFYEDPTELRSLGYAGDERKVYKRSLSVLAPAKVPVPEDSGVRLRDAELRDRDSEPPAAQHDATPATPAAAPEAAPEAPPGNGSREVA